MDKYRVCSSGLSFHTVAELGGYVTGIASLTHSPEAVTVLLEPPAVLLLRHPLLFPLSMVLLLRKHCDKLSHNKLCA